ncbi:MAG: 2Fe-2S iron-sulfur cluster-binding protein [Patescibacteria group bacterium]|jgi:ferredoxin
MPKVTYLSDNKTVEVAVGKSLKEIAHENDLSIPFGCENGICGTCMVTVKSGAENLSPITEQEKETLQTLGGNANQRLTCQCKVLGDVTFDLE